MPCQMLLTPGSPLCESPLLGLGGTMALLVFLDLMHPLRTGGRSSRWLIDGVSSSRGPPGLVCPFTRHWPSNWFGRKVSKPNYCKTMRLRHWTRCRSMRSLGLAKNVQWFLPRRKRSQYMLPKSIIIAPLCSTLPLMEHVHVAAESFIRGAA